MMRKLQAHFDWFWAPVVFAIAEFSCRGSNNCRAFQPQKRHGTDISPADIIELVRENNTVKNQRCRL